MVDENDVKRLENKIKSIEELNQLVKEYSVSPSDINEYLTSNNSAKITQKRKLYDIVLRPEISLKPTLEHLKINIDSYDYEAINGAEIKIKYSGYIEKEKIIAEKINRLEHIKIPDDFDFNQLNSLSTEARIKLTSIKPKTIAQAKRIPGISPSDINVLLVYFGR
jgi:tRNA uridine 5-carboxymethylaminomethyl modification enzyme